MRKIAALFVMTCLTFAPRAFATNGMRMIGFGPVQDSMGGASVAAPLDATIVVTNPAGMTALGPRIDLSGMAFMPSPEYNATWYDPFGGSHNSAQSSERPTDFLPTLSAVYRVQDNLTLGVAALGTAGMGVEYPQGNDALWMSRLFTSYELMRVAPGVAYKINDALSVGLTANLQYAMMSYEAGGGLKHDTVGSLGYGATIGVTYAVTKMVTLGAAYETKSTFQDFKFKLSDGTTQTLEFGQPDIATIGAALRPIDGLLVAADAGWIHWSSTNGKDLPTIKEAGPGEGWNMNWDDQIVVKLGAEYAATKELKVRAGYNYGKSPLDSDRAFENLAFPAIAEHHFTAGAGYDVGNFTVNAAVVYSPEATLKGANMAYGIAAYDVKMSQLAFDLGATYRF